MEFIGFVEFVESVGFVEFIELTTPFQVGDEPRDLSGHHVCLSVYLIEFSLGNVILIKGRVKLTLNLGCRSFGYEQELDEFSVRVSRETPCPVK